jgi:hypothetical protein
MKLTNDSPVSVILSYVCELLLEVGLPLKFLFSDLIAFHTEWDDSPEMF